MKWVPEHSQVSFNPPVIEGNTVELRVPGRILLGESPDGTESVRRLRWSARVSDGPGCDVLGRRPALRLQVATDLEPSRRARPRNLVRRRRPAGLDAPFPRRRGRDRSWAAGILGPQALRTALTSSKTGAGGPMMLWSWMSGGSPSEKAPRAPSAPRCRCRCRSGEAGAVDICAASRRSSRSMSSCSRSPTDRWPPSASGKPSPSPTGSRPAPRRNRPRSCWASISAGRPRAAAEAIARCRVGSSVTGWRQRTAQALSTWSVHAPRAVDPLEMDAAMQVDVNAVETWCQLLGMAVPVDREPDAADVAAQARAALTLAAERRRQRRSADMSW